MKERVTLITGIWDIKRDSLSEGWSRNFEHYLNHLHKLLEGPNYFIIFIEKQYEEWVWERRDRSNTAVFVRELEWFRGNDGFFKKIQQIRSKPEWYNQIYWLPSSTQAQLEWYNPIVMSKMYLLNDAAILDPFDSTHLVWVDGAITHTVHPGYFWKDEVGFKFSKYFDKFSFVAFPYNDKVEVHGFTYSALKEYAGSDIDKVCRGGIFGGPAHEIRKINELYYVLMKNTLEAGYMGTEESLFTIMLYKYPELFQYYEIKSNGLLLTFFEDVKNDIHNPKTLPSKISLENKHNKHNIALYVIGFNFPNQFKLLCESFDIYDNNFISKPKKFLLNNSTDHTTDQEFADLCTKYGFEEIKQNNIGICGGRQFIAEHAEENGFDYYMFFEDDMFFYLGKDEFCKNGFRRRIPDFYNTVIEIAWKENFDFMKWNFTEVFGDNSRQWAWHNVPVALRAELFPENPVKIDSDFDKAPFLRFENIKSYRGVPYATGDIFYCNWPQIVSREGNRKMFLNIKWANPFEQTWMSYMYQETLKKKLKPGLLLASPTEHNRFEHYDAKERREN